MHLIRFGLAALLAIGASASAQEPADPTPAPADEAIALLEADGLDLETRIEGVRRILQSNPDEAAAWAALGELYLDADDSGRALGAFRQAVSRDAALPSSWHWIGILEKRAGNLEEAIVAFDRAREAGGPASVELNEKAVAQARLGRMAEAYATWQQAIADDPGWGVLYANAAKAALALGDEEGARGWFVAGLKAERFEETLALMWTDHLVRQGRTEEALADYEVALSARPKAAKLRYYYGMTLKEEGGGDAAVRQLELALADAAESGDRTTEEAVRKSIFAIRHPRQMRDMVKAEEMIREETESAEPSEKNLRKAVGLMDPIVADHPDIWEPRLMRGVALRRLGRGEEAQADFEAVLALVPDQPNAHLNLGLIERDRGGFETAAGHAWTAASLAPRDPLISVNAALILVDAGQCDKAAQVLDAGGESIPFENSDEIRRRIAEACP